MYPKLSKRHCQMLNKGIHSIYHIIYNLITNYTHLNYIFNYLNLSNDICYPYFKDIKSI